MSVSHVTRRSYNSGTEAVPNSQFILRGCCTHSICSHNPYGLEIVKQIGPSVPELLHDVYIS
jgi:hypothetical protein